MCNEGLSLLCCPSVITSSAKRSGEQFLVALTIAQIIGPAKFTVPKFSIQNISVTRPRERGSVYHHVALSQHRKSKPRVQGALIILNSYGLESGVPIEFICTRIHCHTQFWALNVYREFLGIPTPIKNINQSQRKFNLPVNQNIRLDLRHVCEYYFLFKAPSWKVMAKFEKCHLIGLLQYINVYQQWWNYQ